MAEQLPSELIDKLEALKRAKTSIPKPQKSAASVNQGGQSVSQDKQHLANVRVLQKNLVFIVGLSPALAKEDVLRKYEFFGRYGTIKKVAFNMSHHNYAGSSSTATASLFLY